MRTDDDSEEELLSSGEPQRDPSADFRTSERPGEAAPRDDATRSETPAAGAPAAEWTDERLERALAALLFASPEPLSAARLSALIDGVSEARVEIALQLLTERLRTSGLPFELVAIAGGWQMLTARDTAETVARLAKVRKEEKVSPAALETLAVVAYRQPVTKAEIEAIRGVQVGPILRTLVDRGLVKVSGRSDDPGRALLYATTRKFLESFGLASLEELPRDAELVRDA
jgi:segregation and condensation protein B